MIQTREKAPWLLVVMRENSWLFQGTLCITDCFQIKIDTVVSESHAAIACGYLLTNSRHG